MDYRYFYFLWSLIFLTIWLILFLHRKDLREDMLFISFFFGWGGVISQFTHLVDWWRPLTLTGTPVGIEDFIIGFSIGGIASVIYIEMYHLKFKSEHHFLKMKSKKHYFMGDIFLFTFALVFLGMFYIAHLSSFYSVVIAYLSGIGVMAFYRKDLILDSAVSGIIMLIMGFLIYCLLFLLYPEYILKFWYLRGNWYSQLMFGIPLSEYIWFFFTGAFIGPLYEFVRNKKLLHIKISN